MKQMSSAQGGFEKSPKAGRRADSVAQMDRVVPWKELCELIEPHYPKAGRGRLEATLISAPTSTKNRDHQRDPEMGATKKGGQWLFGMKAHIGVHDKSKLIRTVRATPGNTADAMMLRHLPHGRERCVWGDKAYFGLGRVIAEVAPRARDLRQLKNNVNRRVTPLDEIVNRIRSSTRAKVEHCFGVIKCIFGWRKLSYRGLAKNATG